MADTNEEYQETEAETEGTRLRRRNLIRSAQDKFEKGR